jgi:plastocyanin
MKKMKNQAVTIVALATVLSALALASAGAAQWNATVGAQSNDKGDQALAFLPNEIWIHAGDRIKWTFDAEDIHTVTFLRADQPRPFFADGCPGFSTDPATYDGSTCVTTPPLIKGSTFTVIFPTAGNFKLVCLVHENMTAVVHVFGVGQTLPHDQGFYNKQAENQRHDLLDSAHKLQDCHPDRANSPQGVTAGAGAVTATAGGSSTVSVMRFCKHDIEIRPGQTVEWDNQDPVTPHTITFGTEPPGDPAPPSPDVTIDPDGARHAIIASTSASTHSGFIIAAPQERLGLPQSSLGVTRFRVTFPNVGTFPYICALHDDLGMTGRVVVHH